MKHRSRLLTIAVVPIVFSRSARHFFQNDSTLRANNALCLVRNSSFNLYEILFRSSLSLFWNIIQVYFCKISNARCICFQDASPSLTPSATEGLSANRMANKRKSVAIPVDFAMRRLIQSADEVFHIFLNVAAARAPSPPNSYTFYTHFISNIHFDVIMSTSISY